MQQAILLNTQGFEQVKISQLNLKLKKWRLFTIFLFTIALILSTTLILTISAENPQTIDFLQQIEKVSQACTNFQFNDTNLTQFRWSIKYNTTNQYQKYSASQATKVLSLNLSNNLLKQFSHNSLPDLLLLKLFTKKLFQNYYIENVSNNNFPKLRNFSVPRVSTFSNNYLPSLVNFQQNNFFYVNYFDNNYMPTLNGSRNFYKSTSLTGNTMGLQGLRFDVGPGFQFYNNTLLELNIFQIICWGYDDLIPTSKIMNNNFSNLQTLGVDCNIIEFKQSKKLKKLKVLFLKSTGIKQLSNDSYPKLQRFHVQAQNLKSFTNNDLPQLQDLVINARSLVNVCEGNNMPNLKSVQIYRSQNLTSIDCLKNAQNLEYLSLQLASVPLQNFYLQKLKYLNLAMEKNPKFGNNSFPSIEAVVISHIKTFNSLKSANITFGSNLSSFYMTDSNLQELNFDKEMPKLAKLYVTSSNLSNINCTSFKNVKELVFSQNKLKDDVIDTLINCNLTNIAYLYLEDNLIADKAKAKGKLLSKYPNLYISL